MLAMVFAGSLTSVIEAPEASAVPACGVLESGAADEAIDAVNKACDQIGTPYSWAGGHGNTPGPSYGDCVPGDAWNDCNIKGLDCSGLTRYAYYLAVGSDILGSGNSGSQWSSSRAIARFDRADGLSPLLPGDLVFFGGSAASIHHVAIYLGDGYMVEAPESGSYVRVSSMAGRSDYYGAVRFYKGGQPGSSRPARDYDGDGRGDLFARKPDGTYVFYKGYDGGKYGSAQAMSGGWNNFNLIEGVGDATGDRRPDVVARAPEGNLYLYHGYDGGKFGTKTLISGGWDNFNLIEGVGDVTGNGTQDLFVRKADGTALLYRGDGHGKFNNPIEISGGWNNFNRIEGVGDVTGEGVPDLVTRSAEGELYLYRGYRTGKFGTKTLISGGWNNFNLIEGVGDATGNGTADLFVRRPDGTALIYRGDGEGKFNNPITINAGWDNFNLITQ